MVQEDPRDMANRLYARMKRRGDRAKTWHSYYDGDRPLLFASPEFAAMKHGDLFQGFSDNWCQLVPDSTVERLVPLGFRTEGGELDEAAGAAWKRNEADVEVGLAMLEALVSGRAYAMVWRPNGGDTEITFMGEGEALVEYVPGRRRARAAGITAWRDNQKNIEFCTLFTPDTVWRFQRTSQHHGQWEDRTDDLPSGEPPHFPNPMGAVPIVEMPNRSRLNTRPISELKSVAPLQDAVNTLWANMMTASDYLALPARIVMGMERPMRDILDDAGEVIGEEEVDLTPLRSNRLLWLEGREASVAEYSPADLGNYLKVIEAAVQHIAAQTRTPPHYLLGQMVNISADALSAAEAGLVAKVTERQRYFGAALREVMRLEAIAAGEPGRAVALALGSVVWRDAQFRSEAQYADALTKYKSINVPDEALWERIPGVEPVEVERWKSMRTDQAAAIVGGDLASLMGAKPEPEPEDVAA